MAVWVVGGGGTGDSRQDGMCDIMLKPEYSEHGREGPKKGLEREYFNMEGREFMKKGRERGARRLGK